MDLLKDLLESSDTESYDKAYQLKSILDKQCQQDTTQAFYDAIDEYDFDTALSFLDSIVNDLELYGDKQNE